MSVSRALPAHASRRRMPGPSREVVAGKFLERGGGRTAVMARYGWLSGEWPEVTGTAVRLTTSTTTRAPRGSVSLVVTSRE